MCHSKALPGYRRENAMEIPGKGCRLDDSVGPVRRAMMTSLEPDKRTGGGSDMAPEDPFAVGKPAHDHIVTALSAMGNTTKDMLRLALHELMAALELVRDLTWPRSRQA
jgi:hypothetical protein